jgi:hypothetical protein
MSNEREFVTIEPKSRWPALIVFAAIGAVVAILALIVLRARGSDAVDEKIAEAATAVVSAKPALENMQAAAATAIADPNLIKSPTQPIENMVPTAVADRYKERASAAEKRNKELAAKVAVLERRLEQIAREKEDLRRSMLPPPPAEDEEVLQMLEPVLAEKIR